MLRRMPPSNPNPEFAPTERVNAHRKLAEDFTRRVLGLEWAWISDESSLWDFHTEKTNDALFAKIPYAPFFDVPCLGPINDRYRDLVYYANHTSHRDDLDSLRRCL
jgi:hypothetical protein